METKWLKVDNIVDNLMNHPHIVQAAKLLKENEILNVRRRFTITFNSIS